MCIAASIITMIVTLLISMMILRPVLSRYPSLHFVAPTTA